MKLLDDLIEKYPGLFGGTIITLVVLAGLLITMP